MADETAKQAALGLQLLTVTILAESEPAIQNLDQDSEYEDSDLDIIQKLGADYP